MQSEVFTEVRVEVTVCWVVVPCSLAEVHRRFEGACFLQKTAIFISDACRLLVAIVTKYLSFATF
jgi:hypothetical protein